MPEINALISFIKLFLYVSDNKPLSLSPERISLYIIAKPPLIISFS